MAAVELEVLKQFKKNVADILTPNDTDPHLLKWLKSKNYHIKKAEASFREAHAFREFYALDRLFKTTAKPEVAEKFGISAFLGYAKDGSVIRYTNFGRGDHYGLIASMSAYPLGLYGIRIMEEDCEQQRMREKITGESVLEITYVLDLEGLHIPDILHRCVYETGVDLVHIAQEFYPEIWGSVFFINAPPYFDAVFNLFKPVMRMSLIQKTQVLSRDSTAEVLLKYIDEDVLPDFLGGQRTDFKPLGRKVPEKYYLCHLPFLNPSDPGVIDVCLRPRSVYNHPVMVSKPNTTIRVEVRTERGSIQMSIYYRNITIFSNETDELTMDETEEHCHTLKVSPVMRVQTHMSPINDTNIAPKPGLYIYRFINCSSWFTSRRLMVRIMALDS
ncbi:SEC14-like protein 2 [Parasteatoda tepidariorum]|uniref:SEC14-like protein 2 n=1 Tax=Parasteatoda tepidariorum TaxID=114398 RepID=UPI00077FB4BC|nr:SEC14-like protein 2 [Parasteatoda tepidariorum]XP_015904596.1 SEC14-like protein 2 [Parasteatoda tepidariorum]